MSEELKNLSNDDLLEKFIDATARAGASSGGMVIDVVAVFDLKKAHKELSSITQEYKDEVRRRLNLKGQPTPESWVPKDVCLEFRDEFIAFTTTGQASNKFIDH